jgi:SNF2 family DNA or RNA helicase
MLTTPASLLEMRRDQQQLAEDMDERIRKFVFSVPSASARKPILDSNTVSAPGEVSSATLDEMLLEPLEEILHPFRNAQARLTSSFPDKSLIQVRLGCPCEYWSNLDYGLTVSVVSFPQFDAGKLQTLAGLLRELKRGGHRVLIFTQMSKMLDILEAFLNLNGHTYLRLDGSTGVDRRQRLMDRFNSDPKIFCFILSTRSGGLGINLTGADSVVFYDQDWNPAM